MKVPISRKISVFGLILAGLWLVAVLGAALPDPKPTNAVAEQKQKTQCVVNAKELLSLINNERERLGAPALTINSDLASIANNKLVDMRDNKYYGHLGLDGSKPDKYYRQFGVDSAFSEDLDVNAMSPAADWTALKGSPSHYKSLVNPQYTRIGIGSECEDYTITKTTGPDDNSNLVGKQAQELTVIELTPDL